MFSAIFIERPRLATVIAIVTTIAGLLSLLVIPVAQYPDIVPPQVSVTTLYPGASAAIVDATIALRAEFPDSRILPGKSWAARQIDDSRAQPLNG